MAATREGQQAAGPETTFGQRLRITRELRGRSAIELSQAAGLGRNAVGEIEREANANPTLRTIEKLARALDVDAGWLATGRGSAIPNRPAA